MKMGWKKQAIQARVCDHLSARKLSLSQQFMYIFVYCFQDILQGSL